MYCYQKNHCSLGLKSHMYQKSHCFLGPRSRTCQTSHCYLVLMNRRYRMRWCYHCCRNQSPRCGLSMIRMNQSRCYRTTRCMLANISRRSVPVVCGREEWELCIYAASLLVAEDSYSVVVASLTIRRLKESISIQWNSMLHLSMAGCTQILPRKSRCFHCFRTNRYCGHCCHRNHCFRFRMSPG